MDYRQSALRRSAAAQGNDHSDVVERARPKSRRGNYDSTMARNSSEDSDYRRNARPTSAYRGETSSQLSTGSFGASSSPTVGRLTTGGFSSIDRPITQQGLSGMRTGTGIGRQRQLKDRRYWEEVLNGRIKSLKQEINRLQKLADTAARERSANKHYEARGRELAQELTDLQGRLSDYNIASQLMTATDISTVQKQTSELREANNKAAAELEAVFAERQNKESQIKQLTEQINKEKNAIDMVVANMSTSEKAKYTQLKDLVGGFQEESEHMRIQIDEISQIKSDLEKQISMSQMKVHMVDMLRKLTLLEEKRDALKEEMNNKLQPAQERDQLLNQVREDNAAIASMESNTNSVKEEIKRAQEKLEQAEQDLEEGQSERHQKYRELKKREETMDNFMSTFEQNMKEEKSRLSHLEADIVFALEHVSSNIENLNLDEIDLLKHKTGGFASTEIDSNKSVEALSKDYERLENQTKRAVEMRERLITELRYLPEKIKVLKDGIESMSDLEKLRAEGANRRKILSSETETLRNKLRPTEAAVKEAEANYRELQKQLDGNEMYTQLNAMEEKLAEIEKNNAALREDIASITIKTDYEPLKKQVFDRMKTLNDKLKLNNKN